jgi:tRNA1(Val) A37 N6-methylase TrmN6
VNVNGNEIADRLAKEAAKEAEQNQLDSHNTITKQDVKKAFYGFPFTTLTVCTFCDV